MTTPLQPLLHDRLALIAAPMQAWSDTDGRIGSSPVDGVYCSDVRVLCAASWSVEGSDLEHLSTSPDGADAATFVFVARGFRDPLPDPYIRVELTRSLTDSGLAETIRVSSRRTAPLAITLTARVTPDLAPLDRIKQGLGRLAPTETPDAGPDVIRWGGDGVHATIEAPGAVTSAVDGSVRMTWTLEVPARGSASAAWSLEATDELAVVGSDSRPAPWSRPTITGDDRLSRWVDQALDDLDALRMTTVAAPGLGFVAAGAPWFFTLFGRDSLWTARFLLPLGTDLAHDTVCILASMQGASDVPERAEEPGKIMHELRRGELAIDDDIRLPPLYFGTVDATALWVLTLCDAMDWGLDDTAVEPLLPNLEAALAWMRDHGDADGDGLLEYVDRSGRGLANQGWKDSGDSVQWRDGRLAEGPIALCEVQGYAFEAAMRGAALLERFGRDGELWRSWAERLKVRFHDTFWVSDPRGAYPAIALDAHKRPIDTLTSNIGHLLGTGLLDERQSALVARRLVGPELDSGYGLRTMSTDSTGYWPLSYHGGAVWAHDTAIAVAGLTRAGFRAEADQLAEGLIAAASGFAYRMPELHSGDAAADLSTPVPYPAACRPQAWSAAAAVSVLASRLGLAASATDGVLGVSPGRLARTRGDGPAIRRSGCLDLGRPQRRGRGIDGRPDRSPLTPVTVEDRHRPGC